jgi:protein-tyrosine phosphatase
VTASRHSAGGTFRVLFVCTANKCRSPIAEYLLREALVQHWGASAAGRWEITSAGVNAGNGRPMDPKAQEVLAERGIEAAEFITRRLTPTLAHGADLILTATREHRGQVALLEPSVLSRMFTVNQFGYLLSTDGPADSPLIDSGFGLIGAARAGRSQLPARTDDDDIADPVGRPLKDFRRCADILQVGVQAMLSRLSAV